MLQNVKRKSNIYTINELKALRNWNELFILWIFYSRTITVIGNWKAINFWRIVIETLIETILNIYSVLKKLITPKSFRSETKYISRKFIIHSTTRPNRHKACFPIHTLKFIHENMLARPVLEVSWIIWILGLVWRMENCNEA